MTPIKTIRLNTGADIPWIGIGASQAKVPEGRDTKKWLLTAIQAGYRHIDTANIYGTESAVADAIQESGVPREEFFITTKLDWTKNHCIPEAINESLKKLRTTYIDLYMLHWPQCAVSEGTSFPKNIDGTYKLTDRYNFRDSWKELEVAYSQGKCRAIGVSNFSIKTLEDLLEVADIIPAANQVELHPYLAQNELLAYCKSKGIAVIAYTPGGRSIVRSDPEIKRIAEAYHVSPTQVILAWHATRGTIVLPKSINAERQRENTQMPELRDEDVLIINQLDRKQRISNGADENGQVYGWSYKQLGWE